MYILSLKCNNIYMFDNFEVDFTYGRKISHFLSHNDLVFPNTTVYVRKKMIVMGGNAAGKTTFGKLLCAIFNLLHGRLSGDDARQRFEDARFNKKIPAKFIIELAVGGEVHLVTVVYDKNGFVEETVCCCKVQPRDNVKNLRCRLAEKPDKKVSYVRPENYDELDDHSKFISHFITDERLTFYRDLYAKDFSFSFCFSGTAEFSEPTVTQIQLKTVKKFLPVIDNSIDRIVDYVATDSKVRTKPYTIIFKNNEELAMVEENQIIGTDRLSHGTNEALNLISFFEYLLYEHAGVGYLDEKMAHMHTELEKYLVYKMCCLAGDSQLFVTTHNSELLNLNLPNNSFMIFRRNRRGFNEVFFTNDRMGKGNKYLKSYYDNDYFGVLPDYSELEDFFEELVHE